MCAEIVQHCSMAISGGLHSVMVHLVLKCQGLTDLHGHVPGMFREHQPMHNIMWQPDMMPPTLRLGRTSNLPG